MARGCFTWPGGKPAGTSWNSGCASADPEDRLVALPGCVLGAATPPGRTVRHRRPDGDEGRLRRGEQVSRQIRDADLLLAMGLAPEGAAERTLERTAELGHDRTGDFRCLLGFFSVITTIYGANCNKLHVC